MEKISVCIINKTDFPNPSYATSKSAGMDLRANLDHPVIIRPGRRAFDTYWHFYPASGRT